MSDGVVIAGYRDCASSVDSSISSIGSDESNADSLHKMSTSELLSRSPSRTTALRSPSVERLGSSSPTSPVRQERSMSNDRRPYVATKQLSFTKAKSPLAIEASGVEVLIPEPVSQSIPPLSSSARERAKSDVSNLKSHSQLHAKGMIFHPAVTITQKLPKSPLAADLDNPNGSAEVDDSTIDTTGM